MYHIHFTNHGYFSQTTYNTLEEAVTAGMRACFEFTVHAGSDCLAAWSPIRGLRFILGVSQ